jgi:hypothetical protein
VEYESFRREMRTPLSQLEYLLDVISACIDADKELCEIVALGQRAIRRDLQANDLTCIN